mmetsp:Transcript_11743/g.23649  ORF Transcript_11743/g.23649 Transcript_11743/m.23649 type:complete len:289 (-) Transcript_11743:551-1417(-)
MALGAGGSKAGATGGDAVPTGLGPGAKTPQVRAQEHADKKRQFEARKAQTPGPGSYTPASKGPGAVSSSKKGSVSSNAGSAAFASKSKRISDALAKVDEKGDPGAYDPYTLKELASTSKKSASKSMKSGSGSFGARHQRKMHIDIMGEATPGPGAYNGDLMMRTGKKANLSAFDTGERMPSSAFKSKEAQRAPAKAQHVPGPGAYTPNPAALEPNKRNPANGMKAKGNRFKGASSWERAQATEPGPGAYEIEYLRSGSKSNIQGMVGAPQAKDISFLTDSIRELPWDQ